MFEELLIEMNLAQIYAISFPHETEHSYDSEKNTISGEFIPP